MRRPRAASFLAFLTTTSAAAFVMVACDLDLKPYVDPVEGGVPFTPFDAGGSSSSGGNDAGADLPTDDDSGPPKPDAGSDAGSGRKRVFITSTVTNGQMGGVQGANALCAQRAASLAGGGTFIAWISVTNDPVLARLTNPGPYYLVDQQTLVFTNKAAIPMLPAVPIDRDETNKKVENPEAVWTGTQVQGTVAGNNCSNFGQAVIGTGLSGTSKVKTAEWTQAAQTPCQTQLHLYCFEQ